MRTPTANRRLLKSLALCGVLALPVAAHAIPALQVYLQGATYDDTTDTWVLTSTDPFKLWVIGDVGSYGTISNVKLSIAYLDTLSPTFSLTSGTTGGYGGYTDPSTPTDPVFSKTVTDGSAPTLTDGSSLAPHGIYGSDTNWTEYVLGNFTLTDSPVCDFSTPLPDGGTCDSTGQINVYTFAVSGVAEGSTFHFDVYDNIVAGNHVQYINAPYSHDGEGTSSSSGGGASTSGPVPEPGTLTLLGVSMLGGLFAYRRRSRMPS